MEKLWKIKKSLLEDLIEASNKYYPDEFMCFLSGNKKTQEVKEIVFLPTTNGKNFASINTNIIPFDPEIIGSVHSHPNGVASPSTADKTFFRNYKLNIIIGTGNETKTAFFNNQGHPEKIEILD
jgi:proteasome lid subunit RPN8/RPN11